jgi:MFS family permease
MKTRTWQTFILILSIFIFATGFGIIIPVIPYYARSAGGSAFVLGLLLAVFSFLQFFCGPFWGKISDHIGRKPVVVIGLAGFTLAFIMLGLTNNLMWVFLAVIIGGALSAGIQPAAMAFIADISTPEERGGLMGAMGAAMGIGLIMGPCISSFLTPFGLSVPFFVAASIAFLTMLGVNITIQEQVASERRLKADDLLLPVFITKMIIETLKQMASALKTSMGIYLVATLAISFAIAGFEGTFSYYLMDIFKLSDVYTPVQVLGLSIPLTGPLVTGIALMLMGIVMAICQGLLVGKLINRFGEELVIMSGLIISSAGLILMLLPGNIAFIPRDVGLVIGCICVVGVGSGLVFPSLNTLISRRTDEKNQGVVLGTMASYGNFGRIFGSPIAGYTYDIYIAIPYLFSAIVMAATSVGIFVLAIASQKKDQVPVAAEQLIIR